MSKSKPTEKIYVDGCTKRLEFGIGDILSSDRVSKFMEEARVNRAEVVFDVDFWHYGESQTYFLTWEHPGHLETDEEFALRVEEWEKNRRYKLDMNNQRRREKKEKERKEYERLKKKFEKDIG